jgi:hypothetical protein
LLLAASVAGLYGFVRLLDLSRIKTKAVEPQRIDFEAQTSEVVVPMVLVEEQPTADPVVEEAEVVELPPSRTGSGRRSGSSRKNSGRRAKTPKAAKASEPDQVEVVQAPWPMAEEPELADPTSDEEDLVFPVDEESAQPHIQPLFEPEPFVRMPRQGFGRRGRL